MCGRTYVINAAYPVNRGFRRIFVYIPFWTCIDIFISNKIVIKLATRKGTSHAKCIKLQRKNKTSLRV